MPSPISQLILKGDGRYGFTATVEGADIVVRNVRATWFGGAHDPQDNGETASGVNTKRNPKFLGCALPMGGYRLTRGSPLPNFPYSKTRVEVTHRASGRKIDIPLIDLGPSAPPHAHAAIDLTVAVFAALGVPLSAGEMQVDYLIIGGAKYLPAPAKGAAVGSGGEPAAAPTAGTVGLAAPLTLSLISALGLIFPFVLAEATSDPKAEVLSDWIKVFLYIVGAVLLVVKLIKEFRPEASVEKRFVARTELELRLKGIDDRVDRTVADVTALREETENRHKVNVHHLNGIDGKLDRNHKETQTAHEDLRKEVRHDLREALSPITATLTLQSQDADKQFRELAGKIGGLEVAKDGADSHAAEVRQTLNTILQRLPRRSGT